VECGDLSPLSAGGVVTRLCLTSGLKNKKRRRQVAPRKSGDESPHSTGNRKVGRDVLIAPQRVQWQKDGWQKNGFFDGIAER